MAVLRESTLLPVVLVAILALVAPWVAVRIPRLRLPVAVLEILLGILFGTTGLGLLQENSVLHFLSLFGLSYLMFLSGLEIDVRRLRPVGGRRAGSLWPSLIALTLGVVLIAVLVVVFRRLLPARSPLALAVLLLAGAPTIVLPALKERRAQATGWGQLTLTTTILSDLLSLGGISALVAVATGGAARVLLALLLFAPFLFLLRFARPFRDLWLRRASDLVTGQIDVRGALAIITVFIAFAQFLGTATVLGAFLAGFLVSVVLGERKEALQGKLDVLGYGYFVPFFFVMLGATVDFRSMPLHTVALSALLLLAGAFVISFVPALTFLRSLRLRETLAAALLLSSRLSATLAGASVLAGVDLIGATTEASLVLMCVISAVVFPPLALALAPQPVAERETVVLVGDEPFLPHLAEDLRRGGYDVVVNPGTEELPGEAALLGVFLSDPDERRRIVPTLVGPDGPPWRRVVVECEAEEGPALAEAGLVPFVPRLAPYRLAELLLRAPAGLRLLSGTLEEEVLVEVSVTNPTFRRRALRDLPLPADALVLAVSRGREWIIPRGPTRIEVGDVLTVVARSESAEKIRSLFAEER